MVKIANTQAERRLNGHRVTKFMTINTLTFTEIYQTLSWSNYFPTNERDRIPLAFEEFRGKNARNFSTANLPQAHMRAHIDTAHVQNNFSTEQSQTATPE
jgi:hypothetical protein